MESVDLPEWAAQDTELCRRYDELWLRSFLLSQHEPLAERLDALATAELTDDQERFRRELLAAYVEDVGVAPPQRRELERRINASIVRGCTETLDQILTTLADHGSRPSAASTAGGNSWPMAVA